MLGRDRVGPSTPLAELKKRKSIRAFLGILNTSIRLMRWAFYMYSIIFFYRWTRVDHFPGSSMSGGQSGTDGMFLHYPSNAVAALLSSNTATAAQTHEDHTRTPTTTSSGQRCSCGAHRSNKNTNDMTLENRIHLPLSQYHHRLPLYMLYANYVDRRRYEIQKLQLQWATESLSEKSTVATRTQRLKALERTQRRTLFDLYVQRQYMRALRHEDAMQLETLHFLRHLATGIPHLQKLWRGDLMCEWEGVRCHRLHLPLTSLLEGAAAPVTSYINYLYGEATRSPKTLTTIARTLVEAPRISYWVEYPCSNTRRISAASIGTYPHAATLATFAREHDHMCSQPQLNLKPPRLYIGTEIEDAAAEGLTSIVAYYERSGFLVHKTSEPVTIPVTLISLNLESMALRGFIPEFSAVAHDYPPEEAAAAANSEGGSRSGDSNLNPVSVTRDTSLYVFPKLHRHEPLSTTPTCDRRHDPVTVPCEMESPRLIYSPRDPAYWHFDNCYTEIHNISSASLRSDRCTYPWRVASQCVNTLHDDVLKKFQSVLSLLESVGQKSRHHDLAYYFADVASLAHFTGENRPRTDPSEQNVEVSLLQHGFTTRRLDAQVFRATDVKSYAVGGNDLRATFGEIEPRLVSLVGFHAQLNLGLFGTLPASWLRLPVLRQINLVATGVLLQPEFEELLMPKEGLGRTLLQPSAATLVEGKPAWDTERHAAWRISSTSGSYCKDEETDDTKESSDTSNDWDGQMTKYVRPSPFRTAGSPYMTYVQKQNILEFDESLPVVQAGSLTPAPR